MFEVHQAKVHIFGIPKILQNYENVDTVEVGITKILPIGAPFKEHIYIF